MSVFKKENKKVVEDYGGDWEKTKFYKFELSDIFYIITNFAKF